MSELNELREIRDAQQLIIDMQQAEIDRLRAELAKLQTLGSIAEQYGIQGFVDIEAMQKEIDKLRVELAAAKKTAQDEWFRSNAYFKDLKTAREQLAAANRKHEECVTINERLLSDKRCLSEELAALRQQAGEPCCRVIIDKYQWISTGDGNWIGRVESQLPLDEGTKLYLAPPAAVPAWQPIETAPKDEEVFLFDGERMFVGKMRLRVSQTFAPVPEVRNIYYWDFPKRPTHWMPLPAAPEAEK